MRSVDELVWRKFSFELNWQLFENPEPELGVQFGLSLNSNTELRFSVRHPRFAFVTAFERRTRQKRVRSPKHRFEREFAVRTRTQGSGRRLGSCQRHPGHCCAVAESSRRGHNPLRAAPSRQRLLLLLLLLHTQSPVPVCDGERNVNKPMLLLLLLHMHLKMKEMLVG